MFRFVCCLCSFTRFDCVWAPLYFEERGRKSCSCSGWKKLAGAWRSRAAAEAQRFLNTDFVQTYKLNNSVLCGLLQQHKCRDFRLKLRVLSPSSFIGKSLKFLRFRLTKLTSLLPIITAAVPLRLPVSAMDTFKGFKRGYTSLSLPILFAVTHLKVFMACRQNIRLCLRVISVSHVWCFLLLQLPLTEAEGKLS